MNKKLVNAVIDQLGEEEGTEEVNTVLNDICNHGVNGGFSGFIYYKDTIEFYKKNRATIIELIEEMAEDFGQSPLDMVASFNCLSGRTWEKDRHTKEGRELSAEIARALYGRIAKDDTQVVNALAWFAAEEVARSFES